MRRGQRVIYTTPLKALSNQKLREMRARFGAARVGLQTGDASLALDSDIVVMTTEVLRNIMYRADRRSAGVGCLFWIALVALTLARCCRCRCDESGGKQCSLLLLSFQRKSIVGSLHHIITLSWP